MEWVVFFVLLLLNWIVNTYLVLMLKKSDPAAYESAGKPLILINGFQQWSFSLGYIGLRQFKAQKLSSKINDWCNFYFFIHWVFMFYAFYLLAELWAK